VKRLDLERVSATLLERRPSTWTFAGAKDRGEEFRYAVLDANHASRPQWEFVVHVPDSSSGRIEVRPTRAPNDSALAGIDRRSLTFMPATLGAHRRCRYCPLSLADPDGKSSRRVVRRDERDALPYWLRSLGRSIKQKATVRTTKGTDGESLVALVKPDDHRMMIALFLGTKAWVLKRRFRLPR
jgi:hypothetical protein